MKFDYKKVISVALLLALPISQAFAKDFKIRKADNSVAVTITEDGDLLSSVPVDENSPTISDRIARELIFRHQTSNKFVIAQDKLKIASSVEEGYEGVFPAGFKFKRLTGDQTSDPKASIGVTEGKFYIRRDSPLIITDPSTDKPNFIKTMVYYKPDKEKPIRTTFFSNGLGKTIQTNTSINPSTSIISGTYFDESGREVRTTMAAPVVNSGTFVSMDNNAVISIEGSGGDKLSQFINSYYDSRYGTDDKNSEEMYAYSETVYEDDPLSRIKEVGSPGDDCRIKTNNSHTVKTWHFGVAGANSFIFNELTPDNETTVLSNKVNDANAKFYLIITKDANDFYVQTIKDIKGNTVAVGYFLDGELLISKFEYTNTGRVKRKFPPDNIVPADTMGYNFLGKVTEKWSPDNGHNKFEYNDDKSIKRIVKSNGSIINFDYDVFGREVKVYASETDVHIRKYYDDVNNYLDDISVPSDNHIQAILNEVKNIRGRIFLEIASNELGNVIDVYSYDDDGRISASFTKIPGMAWVKTIFKYKLQGELEEKVLIPQYLPAGSVKPIITKYKYNEYNNLLDTIKLVDNSVATEVERKLVVFNYDPLGKVIKKFFYDGKTDLLVATKEYEDNILGWITKIINKDEVSNKVAFQEDVFYDGFFDGTISSAIYKYQPDDDIGKNYPLTYTYDKLKRLVAVEYKGIDAATFTDFNEAFAYDKNGRITQKVKGSLELDETPGFSDYIYKSITDYPGADEENPVVKKNNQLIHVSSKHYENNYNYDDNGNLTSDNDKGLNITYNWRDMPATMVLRGGAGSTDDKGFTVKHVYNAKGKRVLKTTARYKDHDHEGIAYIGNELVFRNDDLNIVPDDYNLLYANLDEVRLNFYEESIETGEKVPLDSYGEAFFSLKDHLGSTRAILASDGDVINQDWYYAYGEVENLTSSSTIDRVTKVREQYTSKELDEDGALLQDGLGGVNLLYFESRFFDPEISMWIGIDQEEQFWSPYSYTGNGYNPINATDPDGNAVADNAPMYVYNKQVLERRECLRRVKQAEFEFAVAKFMFEEAMWTLAGVGVLKWGGRVGAAVARRISFKLYQRFAARSSLRLLNATPIGSALKDDVYHRPCTWMRQYASKYGQHFKIVGGDGKKRVLTQVKGVLDGVAGRFEYIVDEAGNLTHQMFVKNGAINGVPIKP